MHSCWRIAKATAPLAAIALLVSAGASGPVQAESACPPIPGPEGFTAEIDNPYFPLVPGTTFTYQEVVDGEVLHVETVVTHETENIMGITAVVVRDTVTADAELVEDTFDWYAQDAQGNVWYMGEDTREYEDGQVVSTQGSWRGGVNDAQPGIIMPAELLIGVPYAQECAPGAAEDMGEVLGLHESLVVPYGSFDQVLLTKDWNPLNPDVVEHKYYAPGVGLVRAVAVTGESEELVLIDVTVSREVPED